MNAIQTINQAITRKTARFGVKLSNCGNPDFRQDSRRPLPGTVCGIARVDTIAEASAICREYIALCDLGSGNWNGGQIENADGVVIGRVSYNGRVWDNANNEIKGELCPA